MKRNGSNKNGSVSKKKSKTNDESSSARAKPPPSPAAKVLTTRALQGGRQSLPRRSSRSNADQSVDSSMVNTTADATLDTSTFRNVLNKTNWWKNIDKSMLNIPLADLTGDKTNDSTLDNTTESSKSSAKKKKKRKMKSRTLSKKNSDSSPGKEVPSASSVTGGEPDQNPGSLNSDSSQRKYQRISPETFKKSMGPAPEPKAPRNKSADRESVTSDITEDPPTPQTEKQHKKYVRKTRRVSYNTFKNAMGSPPKPSATKVDKHVEKELSATDITEEDPPTPQTGKQNKKYVRKAKRVSYATFKNAMGPAREPPATKVDEYVDRESVSSEITEEGPVTPETGKRHKKYVRQARRVSYNTFKNALGPATESPASNVGDNLDRDGLVSDNAEEDPPTPRTGKPSKKYARQTRRVSYATFKNAMGPVTESPASKGDETYDSESAESKSAEEQSLTPQIAKQPKKYVRQMHRVSYNTFKNAMGPETESSTNGDKITETSHLNSSSDDNSPRSQKGKDKSHRQSYKVNSGMFKEAMGPITETISPKETIIDSSHTSDDATPEKVRKGKSFPKGRVIAREFGRVMQELSSTESPLQREKTPSPIVSNDDSCSEPSPLSKGKQKRKTKEDSGATFAAAMQAASVTSSPTKETRLSTSLSDNLATDTTESVPERNKQRRDSRINTKNLTKALENSSTSKSSETDTTILGTTMDIVEDNSLASIATSRRKQPSTTPGAATIDNSATEHAESNVVTPTTARKSASKQVSLRDLEQMLSSASTPTSIHGHHSMTTIPEHELLDDMSEPLLHTRASHQKSILDVSTPTMSVLNEFEISDINQQSSSTKQDNSTTQIMEKSMFTRHSISAFKRKGPVRHSESPNSPSKVKKRESVFRKSVSEYVTQRASKSPEKSACDPYFPASSLEKSEDSEPSDQESSRELKRKLKHARRQVNVEEIKKAFSAANISTSPEKISPKKITRQSDIENKTAESSPNLSPPKSPRHSKPVEENTSSTKSPHIKSFTEMLKVSVVLENIDGVVAAMDIDSDKSQEKTPKKSSPCKKSLLLPSTSTDKTQPSAHDVPVVLPDKFTSADFNHALELLENEISNQEQEGYESKEDSIEEENQPNVKPEKTKFSLSDFKRAMETLGVDEVESDVQTGEQSRGRPVPHESVRLSPRKSITETGESDNLNISISTPRKMLFSKELASLASPRMSTRLAGEDIDTSNASPGKNKTPLDNKSILISTPTRTSPRKSFHLASPGKNKTPLDNKSILISTPTRTSPRKSSHLASPGKNKTPLGNKSILISTPTKTSPRKSSHPDAAEVNMSLSSPRKSILSSMQIGKVADISKAKIRTPVRFSLPAKVANVTRKSAFKKRYTLLDFQRAMEAVRSPSFVSQSPSARITRDSIPKFSVHDFEKAVSTFRADIEDDPYDSLSSSRRSSLRSSLQQTKQNEKILTPLKPSPEKKSPAKQQDSINTSGRSLRSSPTKPTEDLNTSQKSQKSQSPLKQQELCTSTLSLRSGKTISPSKQPDELNKSRSAQQAVKTPSPSKQLGASSVSSISDDSVVSPEQVHNITKDRSKSSLVATLKNAMAKAMLASPTTNTSPIKLNKSLGTASQSSRGTNVADLRISKSLGVFEFQQTIEELNSPVITKDILETSISSGGNVSEEITIQQVHPISIATAIELFQSNEKSSKVIESEVENEVVELHIKSFNEGDEEQEKTTRQESSSEEEEEEQETTAPQESSSEEVEEEEEEETTAPQESSSEEEEEEQETTAPQESSSEEKEQEQETTAPQESSSEEEEEEEEQEKTAPQESSSEEEEEEEEQEATAPQKSSSEEEEEQEKTAQESSSEEEGEQNKSKLVTKESSSNKKEREEDLNNTVLEQLSKNNVKDRSKEEEGNLSEGEDTEEAPSVASSSSSPNSLDSQQGISGVYPTEESIDTERSLLLSSSQQQEQQINARQNLSTALSQGVQQQILHGPRNPAILQDVLKGINNMIKESRTTYFEHHKAITKLPKKKPQFPVTQKVQQQKPIPAERMVNGKIYRKPRLSRPKPWMNDRFYKYLEGHFVKQDSQKYRKLSEDFALQLAEYVTKTISSKSKIEEKAQKVAKLVQKVGLVKTNMEFFYFSQDYLPEPFVYKAFPYNDGQGVKYI